MCFSVMSVLTYMIMGLSASSSATALPAVHRDDIACSRRISIRRLSVIHFVYHFVVLIVIFIPLHGVPDVTGRGD